MKKCFTKVIALFIMFSLLSGCSGKQTQKVDEKALHYEADYATLKNSMASNSFMTDIKGGALLFPFYKNSKGAHNYTVFYDGKKTNIMDSNPESGCDFENIDSCSSLSDQIHLNYTVYGDKLYYIVQDFDKKDQLTDTILRSNFDGTEEEKLLTVTKNYDGEEVSFSFTIHKNILYYAENNKIHAYDLSDNEDKICFELEPDTKIEQMFFEDDTVYITTPIYQDKKEVIKNAILKGLLTDYSLKLWQKDKSVHYASDQFLIELGDGEKEGIFYYDIPSNKKKKLLDTYSFGAFVNDDYIILCDIDMKNLYLFDRKGELLDKTACEHAEGMPQGIIHQSFYFANGDKFYKYPIKDDKFQKYVEIELK